MKSRLSPISPAPSPMSVVESNPSCPLSLPPQQDALQLSQTTQVWSQPSAMLSIVRPVGTLVTAKLLPISPVASPRWSVSPRPSCPLELSPQQIRSSLSMTAQVWLFPASIIVACRPVGNCMNGNVSPVSRYPSPNPPLLDEQPKPRTEDSPQHLTEPFVNSAQEWSSPMTILSIDALVPRFTNGRSVPVSSILSPMF